MSRTHSLLFVTGASRGIGAAITEDLLDVYDSIVCVCRNPPGYDDMPSDKVHWGALDIHEYHDVIELVEKSVRYFQPTNIGIVCCAAQIDPVGGLLETSLLDWSAAYRVNVLGNLAVIQGCAEAIKHGLPVRIVMFAGGGAAYAFPTCSAYAATKTAIVRIVENLAAEFKCISDEARIVALAPGAVATDMLDQVIAAGAEIRTRTSIHEPVAWVRKFLLDGMDTHALNGRFIHVRDDLNSDKSWQVDTDSYKLRRNV
jgi:NAD(P)-dependent dehydrogenase (short-subunit alcohol dehydrogenase family)